VSRVAVSAVLAPAELDGVLEERRGVVAEVCARRDGAGGTFAQAEGPLRSYRRTVTVQPGDDPDRLLVEQVVELRVGLPWVSWVFTRPLRAELGALRPPARRGATPWWAPPQRVGRRAAVTLCTLCALGAFAGYLGALLPDTVTYAAAEFGVGRPGQGVSLGVVQAGALLALPMLSVADRRGRRRLIIASGAGAVALSALGSLSPNLEILTATQVVAGACVTALSVAVGVVAVEEMPAGSRAWGLGVIGMCYGLGSGLTLAVLPLAGTGPGGWRALYAIALLGVPWLARCRATLEESSRFEAGRPDRHTLPHRWEPRFRRRLIVLGAGAFLLAVFSAPAGQFQNEYLRTQRHYSALAISLLVQLVGTIGGLGTVVGSRWADRRGRRPVAVVAIGVGTLAALTMYLTGGVALWVAATVSSGCAFALSPVLGVYGGELFPTFLRSRAGGLLTVVASAGATVGLVLTGVLAGAIGTIGPALAVLAVSQAALVGLVLRAYPETAGIELEVLSPPTVLSPDPPAAPAG